MTRDSFLKYWVPGFFLVAIAGVLWMLRGILLPFILSVVFSYIVNPVVTWFEAKGYRRDTAIIGLYLSALSIAAAAVVLALPSTVSAVKKLRTDLPGIQARLESFIDDNSTMLEKVIRHTDNIPLKDKLKPWLRRFVEEQTARLPKYLPVLFNIASYFLLIPFISFFILLSSRRIIRQAVDSMPPQYVETVLSIICEIDEVLGNFMRGQLIDSACVAALSVAGLFYLGIDYFFLLGSMAGLGNMVPYLGPVVGAVPSAAIALFKFNSVTAVVKVFVMFAAVQFIDNWFISPIAVGKSVSLNALEMLVVLMVGGELFGALGVLLAVPVGASLKITFQIAYSRYRQAVSRAVPSGAAAPGGIV